MNGNDAGSWLILILLGGLVGSLGQGARVVVGMKKLNDAAVSQTAAGDAVSVRDLFVASRIAVSLAIGFIAGALAAAFTATPGAPITPEEIAGLAAAGYAGSDFIEGFISRVSAAPGAPAGQGAVGTDSSAPAGAADNDAEG